MLLSLCTHQQPAHCMRLLSGSSTESHECIITEFTVVPYPPKGKKNQKARHGLTDGAAMVDSDYESAEEEAEQAHHQQYAYKRNEDREEKYRVIRLRQLECGLTRDALADCKQDYHNQEFENNDRVGEKEPPAS